MKAIKGFRYLCENCGKEFIYTMDAPLICNRCGGLIKVASPEKVYDPEPADEDDSDETLNY